MLPLIPYNGIMRPAVMLVAICLSAEALRRKRNCAYYKRLLSAISFLYAFFLLYATLLSRTVAKSPIYRLEPMLSLRQAISVEGGIWSLLQGDFAAIQLNNPQSLEAIAVNLLLMVPIGYLLPSLLDVRGKEARWWQVLLAGSLLSVAIEVVQFVTHLGTLDVDDWLFNSVGAAVGYVFYVRFMKKSSKAAHKS